MAKNAQEQKAIEGIVGQLSEAVYAGKVMSVAYLMVDSNNQVQISYHITDNQALTMMGLTKLLDVSLANMAIKATKPKDYMED